MSARIRRGHGFDRLGLVLAAGLLAAWSAGCGSVTATNRDAAGQTGGMTGDGGDAPAGPPAITSTVPAAGGTAVDVHSVITVEFSKAMAQSTVTITLAPVAALSSPPSWNADGDAITVTPAAALTPGTMYTVTVAGQDLSGQALTGTTTFSFTTGTPDTTAPTVVSTNPANAATNVAVTAPLSVTFSEAMDPTTVTLTLAPPVTLGEIMFNDAGTIATAMGTLSAATSYTVTIVGKDAAGNALGGTITSFQFTTAQPADTTRPTVLATVPAGAATGVAAQSVIAVSFSEPMNQAASAASVMVSPAVTCLGGVAWSPDGTFASCIPGTPLALGTTYTVTIGVGARDLAGNTLAAPFVFSFTTASAPDTTPPTILSVTPADLAVGVPVTSNIVVNFSEPMDLASAQTAFQVIAPTGVTGTFTWTNGGATMTFNPAVNFANSTALLGNVVSFQINMAAKDAAGNPKTTVDSFKFTVIRRNTVVFDSDPLLDGYIVSTPAVVTTSAALIVGDLSTNLFYQGYLSFNLVLPGVVTATEAQTTIVSAILQVNQFFVSPAPTPYVDLGALRFEHIVYGPTLDTADATTPALNTVLNAVETIGVKSIGETASVIDDWTNRVARAKRSQYRVRFTSNTNADSGSDFIELYSGEFATVANRPKLTVIYDYP